MTVDDRTRSVMITHGHERLIRLSRPAVPLVVQQTRSLDTYLFVQWRGGGHQSCLFVRLCVRLPVCLIDRLTVCRCVCVLSVCLSACLSVYLSVCLSVCLFVCPRASALTL